MSDAHVEERRCRTAGLTPEQQDCVLESTVVERAAAELMGRGLPRDELVSAGNEALCGAMHRFDPSRGVPFDGYAYGCVHFAMLKAIDKARRIQREAEILEAHAAGYELLEDQPDEGNVWRDSDADKERHARTFRARFTTSLFAGYVGRVLRYDGPDAVVKRIHAKRAIQALFAALDALPDHRRVIELRYLENADWDTIVRTLGVSLATAKRHRDEALLELKAKLCAAGYDESGGD